jgi:hypothetical protein
LHGLVEFAFGFDGNFAAVTAAFVDHGYPFNA